MPRWYVMELGEETGPVSDGQLKKLVENGVVGRTTLIRTESSKWTHADKVKGLFSEIRKDCPYCGESILETAVKCKHCGEFLDGRQRVQTVIAQQPAVPKWSPGIAAVLSFVIPGLGQLYKGQVIGGILWCILTVLGYALLVVPGIVLHIWGIVDAARGNPYEEA